jgi:hypothetical protein
MNPENNIQKHPADSEDADRLATEDDVRRLLDDIDAACVVDILLLKPAFCEVEEAVLWSRGDGYLLGRRTLDEKAKQIFDILKRTLSGNRA